MTIDATDLMTALIADHEGIYLLWSGKHQAWWKPGGFGYTTERDEAGRFSLLVALSHVIRSAYHGDPELVTRMVWAQS